VAAFTAATGNEAHGSGANPNFVNGTNDFHPGPGPAIDSADASVSGFELLDLDGLPPSDVLTTPNTGAGVPNYADRGALEAADKAPSAKVKVTTKKPKVGQPVTADASASTDDHGIVSYHFAWGDGSSTTQAGPVAMHTYAVKGKYKIDLTVTDSSGQTAMALAVVQVR
jgi:PKD repeat protein